MKLIANFAEANGLETCPDFMRPRGGFTAVIPCSGARERVKWFQSAWSRADIILLRSLKSPSSLADRWGGGATIAAEVFGSPETRLWRQHWLRALGILLEEKTKPAIRGADLFFALFAESLRGKFASRGALRRQVCA